MQMRKERQSILRTGAGKMLLLGEAWCIGCLISGCDGLSQTDMPRINDQTNSVDASYGILCPFSLGEKKGDRNGARGGRFRGGQSYLTQPPVVPCQRVPYTRRLSF